RLGKVGVAGAGALALDEAAGEARGERDGAGGPRGVEPQQLRGGGGTAENAVDGTRPEAAGRRGREEIARAAALHLVARRERRQELAAGPAFALGGGEAGRHDEDAGMRQHVVRVALVVDRHRDAVGERGAGAGHARAIHPQRRALTGADPPRAETFVREDGMTGRPAPRRVEAGHGDGDGVIHDRLGLVDDRRRQVGEAKAGDELAELDRERVPGPQRNVSLERSTTCSASVASMRHAVSWWRVASASSVYVSSSTWLAPSQARASRSART